ncbi:MAG TPA: hypothetical protein VFL95_00375 [Gemmatimonadales bacterium]|nr:hypothetical protein [Gemmatimonadales bacterium]
MTSNQPVDVELVYFTGCPHVEDARNAVRGALALEQLPMIWREWNQQDPAAPPRIRKYPSPTILVAGREVLPAPQTDAAACRSEGVPPLAIIQAAVRAAADKLPN